MEITFSPGPDWISRAAEIGTIVAIAISIAALTVAIVEMRRNGKQRQQEARFNYAKRATKLYDLLIQHIDTFSELDKIINSDFTYNSYIVHEVLDMNVEDMLHEARVTHALSLNIFKKSPSSDLVIYLETLLNLQMWHLFVPRPKKPHPYGITTRSSELLDLAEREHRALAKSLDTDTPFFMLTSSLFESIQDAYRPV